VRLESISVIVVTAAGGSAEDCATYRRIIEAQAARCQECGYKHLIFDLGGLGIGEPFEVPASDFTLQINGDSLPAATFKAALVARGMKKAAQEEIVCWLDADCLPLARFNPLASFSGLEAAVTLRPAAEIGLSNNPALDYLNSGVVWIRNNMRGEMFRAEWEDQSHALRTDQGALNQVVAPGLRGNIAWNSLRGQFHNGVLVLDAAVWNSWHPPFAGARIAHFKRGLRPQYVNYI
jgi:hypothetical protein